MCLTYLSCSFSSPPLRATIIQHSMSNVHHPSAGNVSMPGLLRDGYQGENRIEMGSLSRGQVSSHSNSARSGAVGQHVSVEPLHSFPFFLTFYFHPAHLYSYCLILYIFFIGFFHAKRVASFSCFRSISYIGSIHGHKQ